MNKQDGTVGVIIGRFMCERLSPGHDELIEFVLSKGHNANVIVLGKSLLGIPTRRNPLDIDARIRMINEAYPGKFIITWIEDTPYSDAIWSERLDKIVGDIAGGRNVILYGSRDSFADRYLGHYSVETYEQKQFISATELRELCGKTIHGSAEWRAGVIWATQNQFPKVYPTVDIAIFEKPGSIYLGKRKACGKYIFVGGFADPSDESFEAAAIREVKEETGLDVTNLQYICSRKIDDARYRHETDKIITTFFMATACGGTPKAADDLGELHKVVFHKLKEEDIAELHQPLFRALQEFSATDTTF